MRSLATVASRPRPRVLILGTGWGGNKLARKLDKSLYDVRVISPANHFLFTSFLPSTAVGTLEFRCIQEPIRSVEGLGEYYQAKARALDLERREVTCQDIFKGATFNVSYDFCVISTGCKTNTFNTPNVAEREGKEIFFLKHLYHARQIRNRVLECFERASSPVLSDAERQRLLSFVVVGGGPTSCEFTSELSDFMKHDVAGWAYKDLAKLIKVTVVEAGPNILGSFDKALVSYYSSGLAKRGVDVRTNAAVQSIEEYETECGHHSTRAVLSDGTRLPFGMMVWSAGLTPVKFIERCSLPKHERGGRLLIDDTLRVPGSAGRVFALGDCAANADIPLPPLASVAEQQGQYLADCVNLHYASFDPASPSELPLPGEVAAPVALPFPRFLYAKSSTFKYRSVGGMASMGLAEGVVDLTKADVINTAGSGPTITGFVAMLTWKFGYLSKQLSWSNMVLVPMYWFKSTVFGRDISRF
jgi:NADH dehydrogenase FAD-containing subunit